MELKVRVWDIDGAKMSAGVDLDLFMQNEVELQFPATEETLPLKDFLSFRKEFSKFMLWTGLKDKKGVEIYEGDIVATIKHTAIVIFEGSGWKLKHINSAKKNWCLPKNGSGIEVIGNKFSNPELAQQS